MEETGVREEDPGNRSLTNEVGMATLMRNGKFTECSTHGLNYSPHFTDVNTEVQRG